MNCKKEWDKDHVRMLRLRLGWSQSDLARRLKLDISFLDSLESGNGEVTLDVRNELELILKQADVVCDEIQSACAIENALEVDSLGQVDGSQIVKETSAID